MKEVSTIGLDLAKNAFQAPGVDGPGETVIRRQRHAPAYNLADFMRTLALPRAIAHWSLTTLREKLVKIGARLVRHGRYVTFQSAKVAISARSSGKSWRASAGRARRRRRLDPSVGPREES